MCLIRKESQDTGVSVPTALEDDPETVRESLCHLLKFTVRDRVGKNDPDLFILSPVSSIGLDLM